MTPLSKLPVCSPGCPTGYEENDDYCYMMGDGELTFQEAAAACLANNSYLIEPRTPELNDIAKAYAGSDKLWIGATDISEEGTWLWQSDNTTLTYFDWAPNQPNNGGPGQDCVAIQGNGQWGDIQCSATRPYVCQADKRKSSIAKIL